MGYVETLFGHQDPVTSLDALRGETALSAGGQDKTVRYWKIVDETQLVFRGGGRSKLRDLIESAGIDDDVEAMDDGEWAKKTKKLEGFIEGRIDCVAMLDETTFVSGGDSGCVLTSISVAFNLITHLLQVNIALVYRQEKAVILPTDRPRNHAPYNRPFISVLNKRSKSPLDHIHCRTTLLRHVCFRCANKVSPPSL